MFEAAALNFLTVSYWTCQSCLLGAKDLWSITITTPTPIESSNGKGSFGWNKAWEKPKEDVIARPHFTFCSTLFTVPGSHDRKASKFDHQIHFNTLASVAEPSSGPWPIMFIKWHTHTGMLLLNFPHLRQLKSDSHLLCPKSWIHQSHLELLLWGTPHYQSHNSIFCAMNGDMVSKSWSWQKSWCRILPPQLTPSHIESSAPIKLSWICLLAPLDNNR